MQSSKNILPYSVLLFAALLALPLFTNAQETAPPPPAEKVQVEPSSPDAVLSAVRKSYTFPKIGAYGVLVADFHMHTNYSDGQLTPTARVFEAYSVGYDVIAITDHGNYKAYAEVKDLCDKLGIILIRGLETGIYSKEHILALGVSEDYEPQNPHAWAENEDEERAFYQDRFKSIREAGGVAICAHPHCGLRDPIMWAINEGLLAGFEVQNEVCGTGWNKVQSHGTWCYPFAFDWALENNIGVFANSDVHVRSASESRPKNLLLVKERSVEGIIDALRNGRNIAWFDGMLWAREELLAEYVKSVVKTENFDLDDGTHYIIIENFGAVPLQAKVQINGNELLDSVTIDGHQRSLLSSAAAIEAVTMTWENLWTSPGTVLKTTLTWTAQDAQPSIKSMSVKCAYEMPETITESTEAITQ